MIKVFVKKQRGYPISALKIKNFTRSFLEKKGIVSDALVEVWIVSDKKMKELSKEYLGEENTIHNVLSFTESEVKEKFFYPPEGFVRFGQIVICFPEVIREVNKLGMLIEERVLQLLEHGLLHLLGEHHD